MKKNKVKVIVIVLVFTALIASMVSFEKSNAATTNSWSLRYISYAPTSQNAEVWRKTIKASSSKVQAIPKSLSEGAGVGFYVNGVSVGITFVQNTVLKSNVKKEKSYNVVIDMIPLR